MRIIKGWNAKEEKKNLELEMFSFVNISSMLNDVISHVCQDEWFNLFFYWCTNYTLGKIKIFEYLDNNVINRSDKRDQHLMTKKFY